MQNFFIDSSLALLPNTFFHYIKLTSQDPQTDFDIAVLHMGINILNLVSTADAVSNSILHIANQCTNYGIKKVSISSVTGSILLNSNLLNEVKNALRSKCHTSGYHYIDNNKITMEKLWKDGLHLTNYGKGVKVL